MNKFLSTPLGSFVKVFLLGVLLQASNEMQQGKTIYQMDYMMLLNAGVGALIIVLINFLNPTDTRYGKNKEL